jgi:formylglycine-generating enzyme required for sulfatase activity
MKRKLILIGICRMVLFTAILSIPEEREAGDGLLFAGQATKIGAQPANVGPLPGAVRENPKDGLKYVWIPPGTFMMGCSPGDNECNNDERPSHQVTISKGFWMGQTEVTVGAYKRFAAATGRQMPPTPNFNRDWANDSMPIINVTWNEAHDYCAWAGGRLPTEAEWEYAVRAGTAEARYGALDEVAWYDGNSGSQTRPVGEKRANGFGLYDMLGNVWEWVNDWYDQNYYQNSPSRDPPGPPSGQYRVLRGGSWGGVPRYVRASNRGRSLAGRWADFNGVRCSGKVFAP